MESLAVALAGVCIGLIAVVIYLELLRRRIDGLELRADQQDKITDKQIKLNSYFLKGIK